LLTLLNDVLDFSKIEAGKLDLESIDFRLRDTVADALRVLALRAHAKGLELTYHVGADVPDVLVGDPGRLRQVLVNLVGNAVNFTERGEVSIEVDAAALGVPRANAPDAAEDAIDLHFAVRDTGIGIPADKLERVFEPFVQADGSTTRTHGGTGLGLTISARLVERMGGKLHVASTPGVGSTFSFALVLPKAKVPAPVAPPQLVEKPATVAVNGVEAPTLPGQRISLLLVEDNPVNQEVMTLLLEKAGYHVRLAANGEEALVEFEKEPPRLILMDLQMPAMDGVRATRL